MNDPQATTHEAAPTQYPPERRHGCFYYGCITAIVLIVLMALAGYLLFRYARSEFYEWTSPTPETFPKVEVTSEEHDALKKRVDDFLAAVAARKPVEPLVLNSDQVNVLISDNPDANGRVHVDIKGDKIDGQVSMPMMGRYVNGSAELKVSLENGSLIVTADSFQVKNRPLPENFMKGLRDQNLAADFSKNAKNAEQLRKLESIEVKDGKIMIKARPMTEAADETKKTDQETPADKSLEPQSKETIKTESPPVLNRPEADPKPGGSAAPNPPN